jgi:very-short-patch-repair endonuclease
MPLSWNEIRNRAHEFSKRWEGESSERAEAQSFWNDFFAVFGIERKRVAIFEKQVEITRAGHKLKHGRIDAFWKGVLLIEHKSMGQDLSRAFAQAADYFEGLPERDLPRYILVSDFARFRLYDLEAPPSPSGRGEGGEGGVCEFKLADLHKRIKHFAFIAGYRTQTIAPQNPVNIKAAERMGRLHDALKASGYEGHPLEVLLVRLLFCLFAEDTGIFQPPGAFRMWIEERTEADGSDLGSQLAQLFQVLNTPENKRSKNLDEQIAAFPYINGKLFEEMLPIADFDAAMREALLDCCALDWSAISPAIFGALFQSIMDAKARRNIGAHYTSEENILKLIQPLFLDDLHAEFTRAKSNKNKLFEFHKKLRTLTFFDPACGCGNFLVIAYRELRKLELDVLRASLEIEMRSGQRLVDVQQLIGVDVDQFFGIEIEEFPAQIAQVALWLMDHQMNVRVSEEFGMYFARIPLKTSPHIAHGNALTLDWNDVLPMERASYVFGNPPFVGAKFMDDVQREEARQVFAGINGGGLLDYVAAWYVKAAHYMTNSLSPLAGRGAGVRGETHRRDPLLEEKLKTYARELRAAATDAEQRIWYLLRNRNFFDFKFRRQHPVAGYILDFYCADAGLAIELDGGQHSEQAAYDAQREAILQQHGIRTLRFWNNDVLLNTEAVLTELANALPLTPTRPLASLSPQAGRGSEIKAAFVSTNSITQGEQVGVLWSWLLAQGIRIHFAHRTFQWSNEAKGMAAVHCVIIGFYLPSPAGGITSDLAAMPPSRMASSSTRGIGGEGEPQKIIYAYEDIRGEPHAIAVRNINPYLVDAPDVVLVNRQHPICAVPEIGIGNKPIDGGNYLFTPEERDEFLQREPQAAKWFRRWIGADEFLNGYERWCLWLGDCPPNELRQMPEAMKRVEAVRQLRLASKSAPTQKLAATPTRFHVEYIPQETYLLIPRVSSERRTFIPIGFMTPDTLTSDTSLTIPKATLYHFGILTSTMHNAWMRTVCGRLESRYRYSAGIVYNNFPWPDAPSPQPLSPHAGRGRSAAEGEGRVEAAAQAVLDARAQFPQSSLADLYDPLTMPPVLVKAHQALDRAVDACYRKAAFTNDAQRVEFLFERYQQLTSLLPMEKKMAKRKTKVTP